jgi:hypothetical protein
MQHRSTDISCRDRHRDVGNDEQDGRLGEAARHGGQRQHHKPASLAIEDRRQDLANRRRAVRSVDPQPSVDATHPSAPKTTKERGPDSQASAATPSPCMRSLISSGPNTTPQYVILLPRRESKAMSGSRERRAAVGPANGFAVRVRSRTYSDGAGALRHTRLRIHDAPPLTPSRGLPGECRSAAMASGYLGRLRATRARQHVNVDPDERRRASLVIAGEMTPRAAVEDSPWSTFPASAEGGLVALTDDPFVVFVVPDLERTIRVLATLLVRFIKAVEPHRVRYHVVPSRVPREQR